jgi:hypothetical protein
MRRVQEVFGRVHYYSVNGDGHGGKTFREAVSSNTRDLNSMTLLNLQSIC